jgi:hypothetical protein
MIKQKDIVIKTSDSTLTYAEMGDIVCNSASAIQITLSSPNSGLWYRISNVGIGVVTVYYGSALTTLEQTEQCLCLANAISAWFFSKGSGVTTKAELEQILTGEITTHTHPTPEVVVPQATEITLGGIKASPKTSNETQEVKIDSATGKLYSTPPTSATNGLPAGGTAGQIPIKNSADDYDYSWRNPTVISGTTAQRIIATKTDEYTKLLLHLDNDFIDSCGKAVTKNGNVAISTLQKKFGNGSALFGGTTSDYLSIPYSSDWDMGSGNFTVECWFYHTTAFATNETLIAYRSSGGVYGSFTLGIKSGKPALSCSTGSGFQVDITSSVASNLNTWNHVAAVRIGNVFTIYLNGNAVATTTQAITLATLGIALQIGRIGTSEQFTGGYIDEIRISKGIARWTANFTPSESQYFWESVGLKAGLQYFDTTLNKPIWSNGIVWLDATGATV